MEDENENENPETGCVVRANFSEDGKMELEVDGDCSDLQRELARRFSIGKLKEARVSQKFIQNPQEFAAEFKQTIKENEETELAKEILRIAKKAKPKSFQKAKSGKFRR